MQVGEGDVVAGAEAGVGEVAGLHVGGEMGASRPEVISPRHLRNQTFTSFLHRRQPHPHIPVRELWDEQG